MTGNNVKTMLRSLFDYFEENSYGDVNGNLVQRLVVRFREDRPISYGKTTDTFYVQQCYIGIKELIEAGDKEVSDEIVARSILTLMHEVCGHARQVNCEFHKDAPLSTVLALNHHACRHSPLYYGFDEEGNPTEAYYRQPHEIAAQYMGIKCTYEFLCGFWGDEKRAEAAVAAVHNGLIDKDSAYIQKPSGGFVPHRKKVSDILDDLDCSFKEHVFGNRDYPKNRNGDVVRSREEKTRSPDIVDDFVRDGGSHGIYWHLRFDWDGLRTDWIMASLRSERMDPNGMMQKQKALRGISLFVKEAMGPMRQPMRPRPKREELSLDGLDVPEGLRHKGSDVRKEFAVPPDGRAQKLSENGSGKQPGDD